MDLFGAHEAGLVRLQDLLVAGIGELEPELASITRITPHTPGFVRCSRRSASGSVVSSKTAVER